MRELEKILKKSPALWGLDKVETYIQEKLKKTKNTLSDIANFAQEKLDDPLQKAAIGGYLSLLINQKITEHDKVTLKTNKEGYLSRRPHEQKEKINGIGAKLEKGELEITGDTGIGTSQNQQGGVVRIKGNTDTWTCHQMTGGMLIVEKEIKSFTSFLEGGIIIENNRIMEIRFKKWDPLTIAPIDKHVPEKLTRKILEEYMDQNNLKDWRALVQKPEKYKTSEYKIKLRKLDQELPVIIRKIGEPEEKLKALKALEKETNNNPEKEKIRLAQRCGANPDDAVRKYNQELKEKIKEKTKKYKRKIKQLKKELL